MAKYKGTTGSVTDRNRVAGAVSRENAAIQNRPAGWSAAEARKKHRADNAKEVAQMRNRR